MMRLLKSHDNFTLGRRDNVACKIKLGSQLIQTMLTKIVYNIIIITDYDDRSKQNTQKTSVYFGTTNSKSRQTWSTVSWLRQHPGCDARIIARMKHVLGERTIEPHPYFIFLMPNSRVVISHMSGAHRYTLTTNELMVIVGGESRPGGLGGFIDSMKFASLIYLANYDTDNGFTTLNSISIFSVCDNTYWLHFVVWLSQNNINVRLTMLTTGAG